MEGIVGVIPFFRHGTIGPLLPQGSVELPQWIRLRHMHKPNLRPAGLFALQSDADKCQTIKELQPLANSIQSAR